MRSWMKVIVFSVALLGAGLAAEAGVVWVGPTAFHPADPITQATGYDVSIESLYVDTTGFAEFIAPVSLPNGVSIKKITVYFSHESSLDSDKFTLSMDRVNPSVGGAAFMASIDTLSAPDGVYRTSLSTASISNKLINSRQYIYSVRLVFAMNCTKYCKFFGAKIEY